MRTVLTVFLLGAALVFTPALTGAAPAWAALATITLGVVLASLLAETTNALTIALGALAALALQALAAMDPVLASAGFLALSYLPRALRGRTATTRGVHVLAAIAAGGLAAFVATRFAHGTVAVQSAAVLVAGIVAALPLLVPVDDPIAHTLATLSSHAPEPARTVLLRAAMLRRRSGGLPEGLSGLAEKRLERAWRALTETGAVRLRAGQSAAEFLDRRLAHHVDALERIYAAADERLARSAGLEDHALEATRSMGEKLEAEVAALAEVEVNVSVKRARSERATAG